MCIRFLYHGDDVITGFNFDIDLSVWDHKVIVEKDRFYIGILRPDGIRHSYHGVSRNGNAGTLLYVQGNPAGAYRKDSRCMTIADLTEQFIREKISFDDALQIVREKEIVYAPDATMQAMLSDARGRVLVVEPGIGFLEESGRFSLIANDSLLARKGAGGAAALGAGPLPGDDRYQRAEAMLKGYGETFAVFDGFSVLRAVSQEGIWATRVSFVYSAAEHAVYCVENNQFQSVSRYEFS